jgi:hypothetical protein
MFGCMYWVLFEGSLVSNTSFIQSLGWILTLVSLAWLLFIVKIL